MSSEKHQKRGNNIIHAEGKFKNYKRDRQRHKEAQAIGAAGITNRNGQYHATLSAEMIKRFFFVISSVIELA